MDPLATPDDVAHALGLADADALTEAQSARVDGLLARVSREFRREAERNFTPGTTTVRLLTVAGKIRLAEAGVTGITSATTRDSYNQTQTLDTTVDGQDVILEQYGQLLGSGVPVTVTYTHTGEIPDAVVASVAGIVARLLTVEPDSVEAKAVDMTAGPFRVRYADWVSSQGLLTEEECADARSYRYPASSVIIQRP